MSQHRDHLTWLKLREKNARKIIVIISSVLSHSSLSYDRLFVHRCAFLFGLIRVLGSVRPSCSLISHFLPFPRILARDANRHTHSLSSNFYSHFILLRLKNISRDKEIGLKHTKAGSFLSVCSGAPGKRPQREPYTYIFFLLVSFLLLPLVSHTRGYFLSWQIGPDRPLRQPIIGNPTFNAREHRKNSL